MNWHYLENGQQLGPVTEEQFAQLVQQGAIGPDTFIWCKGMEKWQRYGELVPADQIATAQPTTAEAAASGGLHIQHSATDVPAATREAGCSQCGVVVPVSQLVNLGSAQLCPPCQGARARMMATGWGSGPVEYANPFLRLGAYLLDGILCSLVMVVILAGFAVIVQALAKSQGVKAAAALVTFAVMLWWVIHYFVGKIASEGATPAMKWFKLRVVAADGGNLGWWRAFGRFLLIGLVNIFTLNLGHLVALFDKQKRSLHDIICGTIVIKS